MASKKEETRKRIVKAASQNFRQYGFDGIGVDGLARAAGVTSGAFYSHLGSKNAAFKAALGTGLDEVITAIPDFQATHKSHWIKAFVEYYLSQEHREDLACGCAMATLTAEVVRSDQTTHQVYEEKMQRIISLIDKGLAGDEQAERKARAWSFLSLLIGGLSVVRAIDNHALKASVSHGIASAAIKTAGKARLNKPMPSL